MTRNPLLVPETIPGLHGEPWQRHTRAARAPRPGMEHALVNGVAAIAEIIDTHEAEYGRSIAADYVAAPIIRDMCMAWMAFLDHDFGRRIDAGTAWSVLADLMRQAGYDSEGREL